MPVTGVTSALAALSTAGIPPLSGFWSKLIIIIALWKCSQYIYAVIAVLASVITLAYMLTLQRKVFFGKLRAGLETVRESGFLLSLPAVILALIVIGVGIFFPLLMNSFLVPIGSLL
jgi:multicomponent Na+:H+ antiporter subunit D